MEIAKLIFGHQYQARDDLITSNNKTIHYTSASTAKLILETEQVWMRNATLMNDYQEIRRGNNAIQKFFHFKADTSSTFWSILDNVHTKISEEIASEYEAWNNDLISQTYVTCFSEHLNNENNMGRLSMWRAYSQSTGVAIIFKPDIFFTEENKLNVFSYPVFYWDEENTMKNFESLVKTLGENEKLLQNTAREDIKFFISELFHSYAISMKHPGFAEEREWRVVHRPNTFQSSALEKSIETINDIPQLVYKIPLSDEYDTHIKQNLDHIIIGPSNYGPEVYDVFVSLLSDLGIENATKKVRFSNIPLRT